MRDHVSALLWEGQAAARAGESIQARRKFRAALALDPANVSALLWMAWLSDDARASLAYVARALECDPGNPRAHAALRWARRRASRHRSQQLPPPPIAPEARRWWNWPAAAFALSMLVIIVAGTLAWSLLAGVPVLAALAPTSTHTPTSPSTPTSTPTPTPTPTARGPPHIPFQRC